MKFGIKLQTERKRKKITAQKLAEECGVSRSYITLIENGKRMPGQKVILKLAKSLKIKNHQIVNWYLEDIREKLE